VVFIQIPGFSEILSNLPFNDAEHISKFEIALIPPIILRFSTRRANEVMISPWLVLFHHG